MERRRYTGQVQSVPRPVHPVSQRSTTIRNVEAFPEDPKFPGDDPDYFCWKYEYNVNGEEVRVTSPLGNYSLSLIHI